MNRIREVVDCRTIETARYRGYGIRAVCAYNISADDFLVHLYITPPSGPEVRVFQPPRSENTLDDALDHAFFEAKKEVDQLVSE